VILNAKKHVNLSYSEHIYMVLGMNLLVCGLLWVVNGVGTQYGTNHVRGQIGDVLGTCASLVGMVANIKITDLVLRSAQTWYFELGKR
jgi:hypothetical protein